jgi:drug/metabolite transporter (DMT)-like permease
MRRSLVRWFYWSGLALILVGVGVLLLSLASGVTTTVNNLGQSTSTPNNVPLFIAGVAICVIGALAVSVAWIGALIRTAQLGQWVWFVLLLVFHGVMLLVYVIAGPDEPPRTAPLYSGSRPPM